MNMFSGSMLVVTPPASNNDARNKAEDKNNKAGSEPLPSVGTSLFKFRSLADMNTPLVSNCRAVESKTDENNNEGTAEGNDDSSQVNLAGKTASPGPPAPPYHSDSNFVNHKYHNGHYYNFQGGKKHGKKKKKPAELVGLTIVPNSKLQRRCSDITFEDDQEPNKSNSKAASTNDSKNDPKNDPKDNSKNGSKNEAEKVLPGKSASFVSYYDDVSTHAGLPDLRSQSSSFRQELIGLKMQLAELQTNLQLETSRANKNETLLAKERRLHSELQQKHAALEQRCRHLQSQQETALHHNNQLEQQVQHLEQKCTDVTSTLSHKLMLVMRESHETSKKLTKLQKLNHHLRYGNHNDNDLPRTHKHNNFKSFVLPHEKHDNNKNNNINLPKYKSAKYSDNYSHSSFRSHKTANTAANTTVSTYQDLHTDLDIHQILLQDSSKDISNETSNNPSKDSFKDTVPELKQVKSEPSDSNEDNKRRPFADLWKPTSFFRASPKTPPHTLTSPTQSTAITPTQPTTEPHLSTFNSFHSAFQRSFQRSFHASDDSSHLIQIQQLNDTLPTTTRQRSDSHGSIVPLGKSIVDQLRHSFTSISDFYTDDDCHQSLNDSTKTSQQHDCNNDNYENDSLDSEMSKSTQDDDDYSTGQMALDFPSSRQDLILKC